MSAWLLGLRLARREVRRAKGRAALVVALIALPVAALGGAAVVYDSLRLTPEQELDRELGAAAAKLQWPSDAPVAQSVDGAGVSPAEGEDVSRDESATAADLASVLPSTDRVVPIHRASHTMATRGGIGELEFEGADLTDPIHEGRLVLRDGRAPEPGEAALTRDAADRLGAGVGDTVRPAEGDASWEVVGVVEYPGDFRTQVVVHPQDLTDAPVTGWYLDSPEPVAWDRVRALNTHGIVAVARAAILDPPPVSERYDQWRHFGVDDSSTAQDLSLGTIVLGLAMFETVLLAGPAFAVGARRRQRQLAMTAVSGATPAQVRRIVLADGVVLGALGAVVGLFVGAAAAAALLPMLEEQVFGYRAGGLGLWPPVLASLAGVAVLTGVLAALVPAATVARMDVVRALAGLRGITRSRRRWFALGLALLATGAVVAGFGAATIQSEILLGGLILAQLGLVLCTPRIIGLVARAGRFLPLAPRVALRDTARNRSSAAPAVSAVMAAVAGAVAIGTYFASEDARNKAWHEPAAPHGYVWTHHPYGEELSDRARAEVRRALAELPQTEQVVELREPACPDGLDDDASCSMSIQLPPQNECPVDLPPGAQPTEAQRARMRSDTRCGNSVRGGAYGEVVSDGAHLGALTGVSAGEAQRARQVLADGGVVVVDPLLVVDGEATVTASRPASGASGEEEPVQQEFTVPAYTLAITPLSGTHTQFYSPKLVEAAGLASRPSTTMAVTTTVPPQEERDALQARLETVHGSLHPMVETGPPSEQAAVLVLAGVAGVVALGAAAIATGLAAADRRPDLATLAAVGASPRVRRSLSLSQSGVIAGLGALLGAAAGLGTGSAVIALQNQRLLEVTAAPEPYPLVLPWPALAVLAAVPLVAMLGAGLLTRSRLPVERRPA